ncbi:hypothetical protein [Novosphingobium album (ex Liu et al. 2023)]|uniref:hypothetical protein n=1 Tax=Novosphingobium album (ex Liu et al. 2023) TaxID=3031130 RepID=UPI003D171F5F
MIMGGVTWGGKSGGDAVGEILRETLLVDDFRGFINALAALRRAAERMVDRFHIAATLPGGGPKLYVANRIADTNVHAGTSL